MRLASTTSLDVQAPVSAMFLEDSETFYLPLVAQTITLAKQFIALLLHIQT